MVGAVWLVYTMHTLAGGLGLTTLWHRIEYHIDGLIKFGSMVPIVDCMHTLAVYFCAEWF